MSAVHNVFMVTVLISILGSLNWGAHALGHNLVEKIDNKKVQNVLYGFVFVSALVALSLYFFNTNRENYATLKKPITTSKKPIITAAIRTQPGVVTQR